VNDRTQWSVNKTPGSDGIRLEFYNANWAKMQGDFGGMMNQMFMERKVSAHHKHAVILCQPKSIEPATLADVWPINLLNTDYKRIIRNIPYRLRPMMKFVTSEPILRDAGEDHH